MRSGSPFVSFAAFCLKRFSVPAVFIRLANANLANAVGVIKLAFWFMARTGNRAEARNGSPFVSFAAFCLKESSVPAVFHPAGKRKISRTQ